MNTNRTECYKAVIMQKITDNITELCALSDSLADHPELSGHEYESSQKIVSLLTAKGFCVEYPFCGLDTAFRAVQGSNDHRYKVAVLAEYDALPEIGHACGHCISGAASVLAAIALAPLQENLGVDVHVIGRPAEETDGAKVHMVNNGVFERSWFTSLTGAESIPLFWDCGRGNIPSTVGLSMLHRCLGRG